MFPRTANAAVVRTDFDNQDAWITVWRLIQSPVKFYGDSYYAYVDFVELQEYRDASLAELVGSLPPDYEHSFFFVVDRAALSHPEFPILVVDLYESRGRTFRAIPTQVPGIENNLSIANMDFEDFEKSVDEDGVFRGFRPFVQPRYDSGPLEGFVKEEPSLTVRNIPQAFEVRAIRGTLIFCDRPLAAAFFEIRDGSGCVFTAKTDQRGEFAISDAKAGRYDFKATKDRTEPVVGTVVVSDSASQENLIRIELRSGTYPHPD